MASWEHSCLTIARARTLSACGLGACSQEGSCAHRWLGSVLRHTCASSTLGGGSSSPGVIRGKPMPSGVTRPSCNVPVELLGQPPPRTSASIHRSGG